jgi:hypothetical protein
MTLPLGAYFTRALSRRILRLGLRPLSRAFRPFKGSILKAAQDGERAYRMASAKTGIRAKAAVPMASTNQPSPPFGETFQS